MKKKFRVRIKHFMFDYYQIEYAHYYLIPLYNSIQYWFNHGYDNGCYGWNSRLFTVNNAEQYVKRFKCIEDVKDYYIKENKKRDNFYKEMKKFREKNMPYKQKRII